MADVPVSGSHVVVSQEGGRRRVKMVFSGKGRTKQSFKAQCDINTIVARYNQTGLLPRVSAIQPLVGDFTKAVDYHSALNLVVAAQEKFQSLPSKIRSYFDNDPGKFVDFFKDPKNEDKAVELGLAVKRSAAPAAVPPPAAPAVPPVPPPAK